MRRLPGRRGALGGALGAGLLAAAALPGCRLIDQRTFDADAGRAPVFPAPPPAPPGPAPRRPGAQPLVTIPLEPGTEYDGPLHEAIAAALSRRRRDFDVRTSVPQTGTPEAQAAATEAALPVAGRVARLIERQGGRTVQSAEADALTTRPAVLVFVR